MCGSSALTSDPINDADSPPEFFSVCFYKLITSNGLDVRERASVLRVQTKEM